MELWKKKGAKFEDFVAYVYQSLLDLNDCQSIVCKRAKIKGVDGLEGEIDVYYEFQHLNLTYKVAIECKDWNKPVTAKEVRDFYSKVERLSNVAAVMISTSGYQSGAVEWAKGRGIILMNKNDLPSFNEILAGKIKKVFLPDEKVCGEPFWTLMEIQEDGEVTGTYYSVSDKNEVPMLISRQTAEELRRKLPDKDRWGVRGVSQKQLKALIQLLEKFGGKLLLCPIPIENDNIQLIDVGMDIFKKHYLW